VQRVNRFTLFTPPPSLLLLLLLSLSSQNTHHIKGKKNVCYRYPHHRLAVRRRQILRRQKTRFVVFFAEVWCKNDEL